MVGISCRGPFGSKGILLWFSTRRRRFALPTKRILAGAIGLAVSRLPKRFQFRIVPSGMVVFRKIVPVRIALVIAAPSKLASVRSAKERSALVRSAFLKLASVASTCRNRALLRFAPSRFALSNIDNWRFAFVRLAPLNLA